MPRTKKPATLGRPTLGKGDSVPVQIKVSPDLRERIAADADREHRTLSEWLRDAAERKLARSTR